MDKIFKIGLLVLGFSYLAYLFCPLTSQKGRYQYHEGSDSMSVFDTNTGLVYRSKYLAGEGELDIVAWAKDQESQMKEFREMELQESIKRIREIEAGGN